MKIIWKHNISMTGKTRQVPIELPEDCKLLAVANQGGKLVLWESHESDNVMIRPIRFDFVMTGDEFESQGDYIGTAQFSNGSFVIHVFAEVSQ